METRNDFWSRSTNRNEQSGTSPKYFWECWIKTNQISRTIRSCHRENVKNIVQYLEYGHDPWESSERGGKINQPRSSHRAGAQLWDGELNGNVTLRGITSYPYWHKVVMRCRRLWKCGWNELTLCSGNGPHNSHGQCINMSCETEASGRCP
jgi:hypothetical protein